MQHETRIEQETREQGIGNREQKYGRMGRLQNSREIARSVRARLIDPATKYCLGAPSISASFAEMGGKRCHDFLAGSIVVPKDYQKMSGFSPCVYIFSVVCSSAVAKAGKFEWAICGTTKVVP
jgi:hypothetical protein